MEWLFIYDSKLPGPTTLIVGLMHGNEPVGGSIQKDLIEAFEESKFIGKILFLVWNPRAAEKNVRFIDQDLNRSFWEFTQSNHEILRAREIKTFFESYEPLDHVFDLHSTESESTPMIICTSNPRSQELAQHFPIRHVISWLIERIEGISLTRHLSARWAVDLAFECGSYNDPNNHEVARVILGTIIDIQNGLKLKKNENQIAIAITELIRTSHTDFCFSKAYQGFETLQVGEIFATDGSGVHKCAWKRVLIMPRLSALRELSLKHEVIVGYLGEIVCGV